MRFKIKSTALLVAVLITITSYANNKLPANLKLHQTQKIFDTIIKKNGTDTLFIQVHQLEKSEGVDANVAISLLALIISGLAVLISYFTFKIQRVHNVKSLKPFLVIHPYDYQSQIKIEIKNQGLGVAFIKELQVLRGLESRPDVFSWLPPKLSGNVNYEDYYIASETLAVSPNDVINFLEVPIDKSKQEQIRVRNQLRTQLSELMIKIIYADIYDNTFILEESLAFFGRSNHENTNTILLE